MPHLVLKKNFLFRIFIWQLSAFLWFQFWKSYCPMCFQVQSVQKHLRACVIPSGKVALCMCVLPDLLPHSFILPSCLQFKKQNQKKAQKTHLPWKTVTALPLNLSASARSVLVRPALFSLDLHIKTSMIQAKRKWVVWSRVAFFFPSLFLSFPSQQTKTLPSSLIRGNNVRFHFLIWPF